MKKVYKIAETNYDKKAAENLRKDLIGLRDAALKSNCAEWAVLLTHVVGFMSVAIEEMY